MAKAKAKAQPEVSNDEATGASAPVAKTGQTFYAAVEGQLQVVSADTPGAKEVDWSAAEDFDISNSFGVSYASVARLRPGGYVAPAQEVKAEAGTTFGKTADGDK